MVGDGVNRAAGLRPCQLAGVGLPQHTVTVGPGRAGLQPEEPHRADLGAGLSALFREGCSSHQWDAGLWDWYQSAGRHTEELLNLPGAHVFRVRTVTQKTVTLPRETTDMNDLQGFDILSL